MARTPEYGLRYFSFDTDFFENDKIRLIEAEFGHKGIYILVRLLCKIYYEGYCYKWSEDQCFLLQRAIGSEFSFQLISEVVQGCIRRRFFDKRCFDVFGILTSEEIQLRYIQGIARRTEIVIVKDYWLLDKKPSCKVHWIELAAKSDGRVIPKTEENSTNIDVNIPVINKNTSQVEPEIINDNINRINDYINPQIKLDYIRLDKNNTHTGGDTNLKFSDYIEKNCPRIRNNFTNLLNPMQEDKLSAEFKEKAIYKTLDELENFRQINKYHILYNTLLNWIPRTQRNIEKEEMQNGNNKQTSQYGSKTRKSKLNVDELNERLKANLPTILADGAECSRVASDAAFRVSTFNGYD